MIPSWFKRPTIQGLCISIVICALGVIGLLHSWQLALAIGLILVGALGHVEKIFGFKWRKNWSILFLVLFTLLSVGQIIYSSKLNHKLQKAENEAGTAQREVTGLTEKQRELGQKLQQAEDAAAVAKSQIADLTEYGEVATYTFDGFQKSGMFLFPFTPVAKWTEGYVTKRPGNRYYFDCSQDSIMHYKEIIKKCPKFPFTYLAIAGCLLKEKDPSWREYLTKAQAILKKTTKVPLHSPDHDGWLERVNEALSDATKIMME